MKKMFKFIIFGISNIIPGVCSATIALILNVYNELLEMLSRLYVVQNIKKYFLNYLGIIIGIVIGVFGLTKLYELIPFILNMIFLGIVVKSFPLKVDNSVIYNIRKEKKISYFLIGLIIVLILSLLNQQIFKIDYTTISLKVIMIIFINGIVVSFGMILPGISGALMLVIFGLYFPLLNASKNIIINIMHFTVPSLNDFILVITFIFSFIFGLVIASKIIKKAINQKPIEFNYFVNGMILATIINLVLLLPSAYSGIVEIIFGILLMILIIVIEKPKIGKIR
ncbi:MAG: DUF368 domain-containing protein [Bacilli bacterium]|nr:DUF368 domain-containing protein [Mollicutes bacterium]MDY3899750.1 DUF368 domain-containing protein [Bacilli bacterium]